MQTNLTTQAERPGEQGAQPATVATPPGSLQRMVRRQSTSIVMLRGHIHQRTDDGGIKAVPLTLPEQLRGVVAMFGTKPLQHDLDLILQASVLD